MGNSFLTGSLCFSCFFSFSSGAGVEGLVRGKFGSSLSKSGAHDLHNRTFSSCFFSNFPLFFSYDLTNSLSLLFSLVPSQSSSEDQSECTGDESGTGVGW